MSLLSVNNVGVRFGGVVALDELTFDVQPGTICALIGPNGAGKTTLFNVLSRLYQPSHGTVRFDGRDLLSVPAHKIAGRGLARTFQNVALFPALTVLENVMTGAHDVGKVGFGRSMLRLGAAREERALREHCLDLLARLDLADLAHRPVAGLPFGTLKRLELAWAAENGFTEVLTWTQRRNDGMRAVNERLGYVYRTVGYKMMGSVPLV